MVVLKIVITSKLELVEVLAPPKKDSFGLLMELKTVQRNLQ